MKIWYTNAHSSLILDTQTESLQTPHEVYTNIKKCYIAPCDCTIKYKDSQDKDFETFDVKEGQIVLLFYKNSLPNSIVVLDSAEFLENLKVYNDIVQKEKEEWAASKNCSACEAKCECDEG